MLRRLRRQAIALLTASTSSTSQAAEVTTAKHEADEEVDIDLTDPEVAAAATKIQAGFKGFKARKEVEELKVRQSSDAL